MLTTDIKEIAENFSDGNEKTQQQLESALTELSAKVRQSVIEECCKAECDGCKREIRADLRMGNGRTFWHATGEKFPSGAAKFTKCKASALRSLKGRIEEKVDG